MKSFGKILVLGVLLLMHLESRGDIPQVINFQGVLKDIGGNPLVNDTVAVLFKIYDQESGGSVKWSEDDTVITNANGLFNIFLGYKTPIPDSAFNGASRWLGIKIGADAELDPRTQLASVPYSYVSDTTQASAGGGGGGGWVDDGGVVRLESSSDEVGIGTASPAGKLDVTGYIIARRGDGLQDAITIDPLDPNAAIELRSGTTGGTPFIDFANDDSSDFDGRIRLTGNNILAVEGVPNVTLRVNGKTETDSFKLPTSPSAGYVLTSDAVGVGTWQPLPGGPYLPLAGGTMTGPITNTGNPSITMGKGNFGSGNANPGTNAFVAGENDTASGDNATVGGGIANKAGEDFATVSGGGGNKATAGWSTIGGGLGNFATDSGATVGGGFGNSAEGRRSTVAGGYHNHATDTSATVAGGQDNDATSRYAAIGGGFDNKASARYSTVAGGQDDTASGSWSTVGGGQSNKASQSHATVGGGQNNKAVSGSATVAGGENNQSNNSAATVGGGLDNTADGQYSTVAGGRLNLADLHYTTVGGGYNNQANDTAATIAGGRNNRARGRYSFIGGGGGVNAADSNSAQGDFSTIAGGQKNTTIGTWSTVGGGEENSATFTGATVSGGGRNSADYWAAVGGGIDDTASGQFSTVPGGRANKASGDYSFAAGRKAKAIHKGSFVWGDSTNANVTSDTTNQFKIRASNGVRLVNNIGAKDYEIGELYRNNLIVAWGNINADGSIGESFGLSGPLGKPGTGEYTIGVDASAANASALVMVASAEVDAIPSSAATARFIYVNQVTATTFDIYITNGSHSVVDNEFTFIVTAR